MIAGFSLFALVIDAASHPGVKVTRIKIKDIEPPRDLIDFHGAPDEGRA